jgi:AcrR family transcriptional regulator
VRDQIVTAATEHFSRYGYEKTTVSDLAKAIGFSEAYIYKFFESKQAIGEMICRSCLRQIEAEVRAAVAQTDLPPEKLRRMFKIGAEAASSCLSGSQALRNCSLRRHRELAGDCLRRAHQKLLQDVLQKAGRPETSSARPLG